MANQQRGEVGIEVDGKPYRLKPTFDSFCELEDLVGKGPDDVLQSLDEGKLSGLRSVTWCLLQEFHATEIRTLKHASEWIERAGGTELVSALVRRVFAANTEGEGTADPPRAQDGTGERSISAPAVPA